MFDSLHHANSHRLFGSKSVSLYETATYNPRGRGPIQAPYLIKSNAYSMLDCNLLELRLPSMSLIIRPMLVLAASTFYSHD